MNALAHRSDQVKKIIMDIDKLLDLIECDIAEEFEDEFDDGPSDLQYAMDEILEARYSLAGLSLGGYFHRGMLVRSQDGDIYVFVRYLGDGCCLIDRSGKEVTGFPSSQLRQFHGDITLAEFLRDAYTKGNTDEVGKDALV